MATTKEIKHRLGSIKNTKKITKAMELVAASKMRKSVEGTLASRTYASHAWSILQSLQTAKDGEVAHPLLTKRPAQTTLVVLITSSRGLCGAYNTRAIKKAIEYVRTHNNENISFVCVGKKGNEALERINQNVLASFTTISDNVELRDTQPIAQFILDEYAEGRADRVVVIYTDYKSALTQTTTERTLLPLSEEDLEATLGSLSDPERGEEAPQLTSQTIDYVFEPDYETLMLVLLQKLTTMQIYQMLAESVASEHSARMMAMKNASEAAGDMMSDLTLEFNKARQAGITREIAEISAGMASVN